MNPLFPLPWEIHELIFYNIEDPIQVQKLYKACGQRFEYTTYLRWIKRQRQWIFKDKSMAFLKSVALRLTHFELMNYFKKNINLHSEILDYDRLNYQQKFFLRKYQFQLSNSEFNRDEMPATFTEPKNMPILARCIEPLDGEAQQHVFSCDCFPEQYHMIKSFLAYSDDDNQVYYENRMVLIFSKETLISTFSLTKEVRYINFNPKTKMILFQYASEHIAFEATDFFVLQLSDDLTKIIKSSKYPLDHKINEALIMTNYVILRVTSYFNNSSIHIFRFGYEPPTREGLVLLSRHVAQFVLFSNNTLHIYDQDFVYCINERETVIVNIYLTPFISNFICADILFIRLGKLPDVDVRYKCFYDNFTKLISLLGLYNFASYHLLSIHDNIHFIQTDGEFYNIRIINRTTHRGHNITNGVHIVYFLTYCIVKK